MALRRSRLSSTASRREAPAHGVSDPPVAAPLLQVAPPPEVVLALRNVTKKFVRYKSPIDRTLSWFGLQTTPSEVVTVVDGVSFEVRRGECVGLIGQNGAGKSTLLKLITGTMRPTSGRVEAAQSVSAILELGLGFNPEFTGRENIRNSGGMLGYSPQRIEQLMPDIEAFAEIGDYFDRPLRTYSSGMAARLAFALATAEQPDVLIVDEVLSVGDAYFQHKSFARIRSFRENGCTILLVTHGLGDVRELCDRVILIDKGRVLRDGLPDEVIDYYNALITEKESARLTLEQRRRKNGWLHTEFGDGRVKMQDIEIFRQETGKPAHLLRVGEMCEVRSVIEVVEPVEELVIGHRIVDRTGHIIWGSNTFHTGQALRNLQAGQVVHSVLQFRCDLGPGSYALCFGLHSRDSHFIDCYHKAENQIVFEVVNADRPSFIGSTNLSAEFKLVVEQETV